MSQAQWFRSLARRLAPVGRVARRVADGFPWTPLGLLVPIGAVVALRYFAYGELDLVLLVVGYGALGLVALSTLLVIIAAVWLKLAARAVPLEEPLRLETTLPRATGFGLTSLVWLPLVSIRWEWEQPAGARVEPRGRLGRLLEQVILFDRGEVRGVRRRIVVEDAFGLARLAVRHRDPALALEVLPHVGQMRRMPLLTSMAGGDERPHPMGIDDGDRVDLRRYVAGDPARFIHWKVFARARKLMVRIPERALTRSRRTVAYLVAGDDDDASAAAARVALESRAFGEEWAFGADGAGAGVSTVEEAMRLIVRSSGARARGGAGLAAFLARAEREGPATAIVFVPPRPGPWLRAVVEAAARRQGRMRIVIGIDGATPKPATSLLRKLLVRSVATAGTPSEALDEVLRTLGKTRSDLLVVDRKSGRLLGEAHRAALHRLEQLEKGKAA